MIEALFLRVVRTSQRLLSLYDLDAVGHTGREGVPWILASDLSQGLPFPL